MPSAVVLLDIYAKGYQADIVFRNVKLKTAVNSRRMPVLPTSKKMETTGRFRRLQVSFIFFRNTLVLLSPLVIILRTPPLLGAIGKDV